MPGPRSGGSDAPARGGRVAASACAAMHRRYMTTPVSYHHLYHQSTIMNHANLYTCHCHHPLGIQQHSLTHWANHRQRAVLRLAKPDRRSFRHRLMPNWGCCGRESGKLRICQNSPKNIRSPLFNHTVHIVPGTENKQLPPTCICDNNCDKKKRKPSLKTPHITHPPFISAKISILGQRRQEDRICWVN